MSDIVKLIGTIQSYNLAGGRQLVGQNYKNCIRQEAGYCCIQYSVITYNMGAGNGDTITLCTNGAANRCSGASLCTSDFIIIPNGGNTPTSPAALVNYDRYSPHMTGYKITARIFQVLWPLP